MSTFKARVTDWKNWKKMPKWQQYYGTAKPLDDEIYKYTANILISEQMLHRSGCKDTQLKVGDIIEIEIIAYAYKVFDVSSPQS